MTVRVTTAPLSVMTCTLVEGAVAEEVATVPSVDDGLLSEDGYVFALADVDHGGIENEQRNGIKYRSCRSSGDRSLVSRRCHNRG